MLKFCQTEKCKRERELRKQRGKERRFNDPLKLFVERKYPEIYAEYGELYNVMESENPNRKNLSTSPAFKKWLAANPVKKPVQTTQFSTKPPILIPQLLLEPVPLPIQKDAPPTDIITLALQEACDSHPCTFEPMQPESGAEHLLAAPEAEANDINVVDEIINELMRNRGLEDLLEQAAVNLDGDEGIELDHFAEIENDIEPFDYHLEVEPFDF